MSFQFEHRLYRHPDGTEGKLYESCYSCKRDMEWVFRSDKHHWSGDSDYTSWLDIEKKVLAAGYVFVEEVPFKRNPRPEDYD